MDELLALHFRNIFIESGAGSVQVTFTKKGKALISKLKPSEAITDMLHDRHKDRLLNEENAAPFLKAIGIMTQDGRIKADMQRKYKQINEFLRLVDETASFSSWAGAAIHVVDFGCGSGHLTFAMYYYLGEVLHLDAHVTGVDVNANLIERHKQKVT